MCGPHLGLLNFRDSPGFIAGLYKYSRSPTLNFRNMPLPRLHSYMLCLGWPLGSAVSGGGLGFLVTLLPLDCHCFGVASLFRVPNKMG